MDTRHGWDSITTDVITLAWSEWDQPDGFRQQLAADPAGAIARRLGVTIEGELPKIELPEPPHLADSAVQAASGAEAVYPFTCC